MGDGEMPSPLDVSRALCCARVSSPLAPLPPGRYIAFAGIGRPERFFDGLQKQAGVELADRRPLSRPPRLHALGHRLT